MKTDYPSWVFQEQIKRTIDDFILHFVQFTKHLFQDFLKANETHQKTHQCSLHITYFFNHCWTLSRRRQSAFEKNRLFLLEQAKTQGRFKKHTHLCFKLWLVVGVFCTFFTCFILSRSNESASLPPPPGRTLHDTPKKKNQKSFLVRFTVMFLLHRHVSDGLCSPWNHRPVCRVSPVPRLLCTI